MSLQLYPATVAIYQELYKQAALHPNFKYKINKRDRSLICSFVGWLNKNYKPYQLNEAFLIQYFEYQFSRYSGVVTPKGKNNIMLNWLIGVKAQQAWSERKISKRYIVRWRCNKDFQLKLKTAFKKEIRVIDNPFLKLNPNEEHEKQRFYNKPTGYIYCADMTTLYNPASKLCEGCIFKAECIERLQLNLPKLYKIRL